MATAQVVKTVNAPLSAVWARLSDFTGLKVGGPIESFSFEGEGVGAVRTIGMGGGKVVERLDACSEEARAFTYSIINEDSALPFANYSATVQLGDNGDDTTVVIWTGTFEPRGVPEADAVNVANGIYAGAIAGAKAALGG